jgi:carboxyl-terminal processing protease
VGEKTFGEGSQQKTFELPDGAALILSVAKYESPSGKKLEDEGVTPGILVASNIDDGGPGGDGNEDAVPTTETQPDTKKPGVSIDEQLNKALDLLKSKAA